MNRKEYIDKLSAQLHAWDAELDRMEAETEKASAKARARYNEYLDDLRSKQKDAEQRLETLRKANEDAWKEMSSGAEKAFKTLHESFTAAMSKFK